MRVTRARTVALSIYILLSITIPLSIMLYAAVRLLCELERRYTTAVSLVHSLPTFTCSKTKEDNFLSLALRGRAGLMEESCNWLLKELPQLVEKRNTMTKPGTAAKKDNSWNGRMASCKPVAGAMKFGSREFRGRN